MIEYLLLRATAYRRLVLGRDWLPLLAFLDIGTRDFFLRLAIMALLDKAPYALELHQVLASAYLPIGGTIYRPLGKLFRICCHPNGM